MGERIVRDSRHIEREYGREKWPAVAEYLRSSEVPLEVAINAISLPDSTSQWTISVGESRVDLPALFAMKGYLGWVAGHIASRSRQADAVIELGSGWGRNLANAFLSGANPDAVYVAGEYTEAGRAAARHLGMRRSNWKLKSVSFDYGELSLSLERFASATVVTVHSVEQVPTISAGFVDFVRGLADEVTCIHLEPIGWQIRRETSCDYAERNDYNRNLWDVLSVADVEFLEVATDVVGINPDNPTSLVVWR